MKNISSDSRSGTWVSQNEAIREDCTRSRGRGFPNKSGFQKDVKVARSCSPRQPDILDPLRFVNYGCTVVLCFARAVFSRTLWPHRRVKRIINTCTSMRNRCDYMCIRCRVYSTTRLYSVTERTRFINVRSDKWNIRSFKNIQFESWNLPRTRHLRKTFFFF